MTYVHGISYLLGRHRTTSSLEQEGVARPAILQLLVRGAAGFHHAELGLLDSALTVAQASLSKAGIDRETIDVVLFASNSLAAPDRHRDIGHALITGLELRCAHSQLVGFQNCGDVVPLLRTAQAMVASGVARAVLIVLADDADAAGIPRILNNNSYLHSDGASACVVSAKPGLLRIGASAVLHAEADDSANPDLYDLERNLAQLLGRAAQAACAGAGEAPRFVVTHNMNRLYNVRVARAFGVPLERVVGEFGLGHCMASDALINLCRLVESGNLPEDAIGLIAVPTRRSVGVLAVHVGGTAAAKPGRADAARARDGAGAEPALPHTGEYRTQVRESMAVLPRWMQPWLTRLTGKALPGEAGRALHPVQSLALSLALLLGLAAGNLLLLSGGGMAGFAMLPLTWLVITGLMRKMQVVYGHHCVHRVFVRGHPAGNEFLLRALTTFLLVQNGAEYRRDHLGHHNRSLFTTVRDADAAFLHRLGFQPGTRRGVLWRRLLLGTLLSPRFHGLFLAARLGSCLMRQPPAWRLAAAAWTGLLTAGLAALAGWWQAALVVWVPMFFLYHHSALLQFLTEHAWLVSGEAPRSVDAYAERCWGRFLGDPCPAPGRHRGLAWLGAWTRWWLRLLLLHAPVRVACLVGDLPAHDWHHLCGFIGDDTAAWPGAIHARQAAIDRGRSLRMEQRELWGLRSMLDHVFLLLEMAGSPSHESAAGPAPDARSARAQAAGQGLPTGRQTEPAHSPSME